MPGIAIDTFADQVLYCQAWRNDVLALLEDDRTLGTWIQVEQVRYSAYGVPFLYAAGDADSDGDTDAADQTAIQAWIDAGPTAYDVRGDLDLDGDADPTDKTLANTTITGGWNTLSNPAGTTGANNRHGYAGYVWNAHTDLYHIRHRADRPDLGRMTCRNPCFRRNRTSVVRVRPTSHASTIPPSSAREPALNLTAGSGGMRVTWVPAATDQT